MMSNFTNLEKICPAAAELFETLLAEGDQDAPDDEMENNAIALCYEAGIMTSEQAELKMHKMTAPERLHYVEMLAGRMLLMPDVTPVSVKEFYAVSSAGWPLLLCSACADGDIDDPYTVPSHCFCEKCEGL